MKVLILGSGGFLGSKLVSILSQKYEVLPYYFEKEPKLDITDKYALLNEFNNKMPDVVIHAAGITNVDLCETDKKLARTVNITATNYIIKACNSINAKLIYFSTDFVFDGKKGSYTEEDTPNPLSYYASTKLSSEQLIIDMCAKFLILRVAILYGYNGNKTERSFVKWVIDSLKENKIINVVSDQQGTPTLIDDIAHSIDILVKKNGVFHVAGSEKLSRFQMALTLAKEFSLDEKLISPIKLSKFKQIAIRPLDSSLCTQKIRKEGIKMHTFSEGVKIMKSQMFNNI